MARARKTAGWIAVSEGIATGLFFASAPVAVAPVAVGGLAGAPWRWALSLPERARDWCGGRG